MRAALSDPHGPRAWRIGPYAVPVLLFFFAIFGPVTGPAAAYMALFAVGLFNLLGLIGLRQRRPRDVEIACGPGYIDVKKSVVRNQRIRTKSIIGATTTRTASGIALTLQHDKRDQPITLEVESEADAEKIRHALGIGHGGFGTIMWRTLPDQLSRVGKVGRIVALATVTGCLLLGAGVSNEAAAIAGFAFGTFGFIGALVGFFSLFAKRDDPSVVMAAEGLRVRTVRGWFTMPYNAILHAEDHKRGFSFHVPPPYGMVGVEVMGPSSGGLSASDRALVLAQINAAAQRARGLGPQKQDITGRLDVLRRNGENARDWLARLDVTGQMLSAGPGYRGHSLDTEDLWAILEDPEAEAELRAAAARVLRHVPQEEARVRIDAAVAAVRDESVNRRLRVAMSDDLDGASQEIAVLDAGDHARDLERQERERQHQLRVLEQQVPYPLGR